MSVGNDLGKSRSTIKPGIAGIAMKVLPCYWMKVLPCYSCSYVQVRMVYIEDEKMRRS